MNEHPLVRSWGTLVLQGAIALLFGLMFLFLPVTTLVTLVYFFAAFAMVDGVLALVAMFTPGRQTSRWVLAAYGVAGILIGILVFAWPGLTVLTFLYLVAFWALIVGALRIVAAIALRKEIEGEWALLATGVIGVLFGLYVLFAPTGLAALILALGIYAIVKGILLIVGGLRLKSEMEERGRGGRGEAEQGRAAA